MDRMKIIFTPISNNVLKFEIIDFATDYEEYGWTDTVRIDAWNTVTAAARESLSYYAFWLGLKTYLGKRRPQIICNNMEILRGFYKSFCRECIRPDDPWLFSEEIGEEL